MRFIQDLSLFTFQVIDVVRLRLRNQIPMFHLRCLRALKENEVLEEQIMKDVPGWKVGESMYHTDKWVAPMPDQVTKL